MLRAGRTTVALILVTIPALWGAMGCSDHPPLDPDTPGEESWTLGPEAAYPVDAAGEAEVADTTTGRRFRFPDGGHGTLRVSRILSGPEAPFPGEGFAVSFEGASPLEILVDPAGADVVMVLGYGTAPGAYDDLPAAARRWIAVPPGDSLAAGIAYPLTLPFDAPAAASRPAVEPAATSGGFDHYWVTSIPAGSNDATRRMHLELQAHTFIDSFLDGLSASRQGAARAEVEGRLRPHFEWDGLYYTGFWWRSLGALGRIVRPTIHLKLDANAGNIAHETGHYITHVLVGDDVWSVLEGQAPLWDTQHGIRDRAGRNALLEDYAYWSEWLLAASVKGYDLRDPYVIFGGLSPLTVDFPGLEGFGAVMLAALTRTTPQTRNLINGRPADVPVIGLSNAQVYEIIAAGATGVEGLRDRIEAAVGSESDKLPALLQRCGWRHSIQGRLVLPGGAPLSGATVASVSAVGDRAYRGGTSSIPTDTNGKFRIIGEVFPGSSTLRVWDGQDSIDVAISIPWSQPTDVTADLGDLVVTRALDLAPLTQCTMDLFTHITMTQPAGSFDWWERLEIGPITGAFVGGRFTGSEDTTSGGVHRTVQLTADVDRSTGSVQHLELVRTRSGDDWTETVELTLEHVDMLSYTTSSSWVTMECQVEEEATCNSIARYVWVTQSDSGEYRMTGYSCAPDHANGYISSLDVTFTNWK